MCRGCLVRLQRTFVGGGATGVHPLTSHPLLSSVSELSRLFLFQSIPQPQRRPSVGRFNSLSAGKNTRKARANAL